jgi:NADH dehydrogenase (ubiquinone) 1 alpha subcomplex subunit 2
LSRRSFLTRAYPIMKKNNPTIPIMLREAQGTLPRVYARYGQQPLSSLDDFRARVN